MQPTSFGTFTVPLSQKEYRLAEKFAGQQSNPKKAEQVYLNTLAVFAVDFFLRCMRIKTNWAASLSWNSAAQILMDVADLEVSGLGKLECRPVGQETQAIQIPPEVWSNRIGYVAVQLNKSLREATLLGFSKTLPCTGELLISSLRSLEDLLRHLDHLEQPEQVKMRVNLSLWLQNIFELGWKSFEEILGADQKNSALSFRGTSGLTAASVKRAKLINLGLQLRSQSVALLVAIAPENEQEVGILVQLHPVGGQTHLLPNLRLALLLESGEPLQEVQSRSLDNYIQLKFWGQPGESFSIQVVLDDASVTEKFII